jgi:hypothetical protein
MPEPVADADAGLAAGADEVVAKDCEALARCSAAISARSAHPWQWQTRAMECVWGDGYWQRSDPFFHQQSNS